MKSRAQQQISSGNDSKKSKSNSKGKGNSFHAEFAKEERAEFAEKDEGRRG